MTKLTKQEVQKIANLAMIKLSDDELEKFSTQLTSILEYVEKLKEIETEDVEYKSHVDLKNVYKEDVVAKSLTQEEAVAQAKNSNGFILVPKVIDEG